MESSSQKRLGHSHRLRIRACLVLTVAGLPSIARSEVDASWTTTGGGSWSNPANWSSNPAYPDGGGTVAFGEPATVAATLNGLPTPVVTLDVPINLSRLTFSASPAVTISGTSTLTLSGPAEVDVERNLSYYRESEYPVPPIATFGEWSGNARTYLDVPVAGTSGLRKTGNGDLSVRISGSSSLSGTIYAMGGRLSITGNSADPVVLDGGAVEFGVEPNIRPIIVASGGGTLSSGDLFDGAITGDIGTLTVVNRHRSSIFNTASAFTGPMRVIGQETFELFSLSTLASRDISIIGGFLQLDSGNSDRLRDDAAVHLHVGRFQLSAPATSAAIERIGTLDFAGGMGTLMVAGSSSFSPLRAAVVSRTDRGTANLAVNFTIGNAASLLVGGGIAGTPNASILPFAFNISSDEVRFVTCDSQGTTRRLSTSEYLTTLPSGITQANVYLRDATVLSAPVTINALQLGNPLSGNGTLTVASGWVDLAANVACPLNFGPAEGILFAGASVTGPISGSNGLTIAGAVTLSGNSTYTGTTTVSGKLSMIGNIPASGPGPLGSDTSPVVLQPGGQIISLSSSSFTFARDVVVRSSSLPDDRTNTGSAIGTINFSGNIQLDGWLQLDGCTISGNISGPGGIAATATSTTTIFTMTLGGNNTFTGGVDLKGSSVLLNSESALGTGTLRIGAIGTSIRSLKTAANVHTISNPIVLDGSVALANRGSLTLAGSIDLNGFPGTMDVYSLSTGGLVDPVISGTIFNGALVVGPGSRKIILTGDNRLWGTRNYGTIRAESDFALGQTPSYTNLERGTLELAGGISIPAHKLTVNAGRLFSASGNNIWNGDVLSTGGATISVDADTLNIGKGIAISTGSLTKAGPGVLTAAAYNGTALNVAQGTVRVAINGQPSGTSRLQSLNILPGAHFDLTDNGLIIDYSGDSPLMTIQQFVANQNLVSSVADDHKGIGYADNLLLGRSTFGGVIVDGTSILVGLAYIGDTDLDGDVDMADLGNLASHWQAAGVWTGGDLDYNGVVDINDLGILASNWQAGVTGPTGATNLAAALAGLGLPNVSVPEPVSATLLGALSLMAIRRRKA